MEIKNTKNYPKTVQLNMLVYGLAGTGKTTFASTFPKALLLDFENGAKYFGERGIELDVIQASKWFSMKDKLDLFGQPSKEIKGIIDQYETIIIDPIGEAMEMIINDTDAIKGSKNRQADGGLTIAGWGAVKDEMRRFIKALKNTGKNIVLIGHVEEKDDEQSIVKRPKMATKLADELVGLVDIVGYMQVINDETAEDGQKRIISVDASNNRIISKDRTGKLGKYVKPDYSYIADQLGFENGSGDAQEVEPEAKAPETSTEDDLLKEDE